MQHERRNNQLQTKSTRLFLSNITKPEVDKPRQNIFFSRRGDDDDDDDDDDHKLGGSHNLLIALSIGKWQISTPQAAKTPEPILMKLCLLYTSPSPRD